MMTIEQFDNEMLKVINRQLELGAKLSVPDLVKLALNNMKKGNYSGITSSARPFFCSINVEKQIEELMGCEYSSAVYLYSKRIESFYKNYSMASKLDKQFDNMDELKKIIDVIDANVETSNLINLLKQTYYNNDSVRNFIEEGYQYMLRKGGTFLNDSLDNKINSFISYMRYYHDYSVNEQYKLTARETAKNIDYNLSMLQILPEDKTVLLTDLYYGNDNNNLGDMQNFIENPDIIISLLRNVVQTSLVSTNVSETTSGERVLYEDAEKMQNTLISARRIISKLLGQDYNNEIVNLTAEQLSGNLGNLTYDDINFLSKLYMETRKNEQSVSVVENASSVGHKINDLNKNQYSNDSQLLKTLESKEFKEILNKKVYKK